LEPVLAEENRIAYLQKRIRAAKRNQNIGVVAFLVGVFVIGPILAGVLESQYDASKYGGESQYSIEFTILLTLLWVALFVLGVFVIVHYSHKVEKLEKELAIRAA